MQHKHGRRIICSWLVLCIFGFSLSTFAETEIYRSTNKNGNVVFSDIPVNNAQKIELPPAQTYTSPQIPTTSDPTTNKQPKAPVQYESVTVSGITPKATLPHNQAVTVTVSSTPALQEKDQYGVLIDGKAIGEPQTSGQFTIPGTDLLSRGEHRIQAVITDDKKQIVKQSDPITFYIFQPSIQSPTNPVRNRANNANTP